MEVNLGQHENEKQARELGQEYTLLAICNAREEKNAMYVGKFPKTNVRGMEIFNSNESNFK